MSWRHFTRPARGPGVGVTGAAARLRRRRDAAAASYAGVEPVMAELRARMLERLDVVRLPAGPLLDAGCADGGGVRALRQRFPDRVVLGTDPARRLLAAARAADPRPPRWLPFGGSRNAAWVCADVERLPFRPGTFALIWSALGPATFTDPPHAWRALGTLLKPGGLLHFSMPGPDTLRELRAAAAAAGLVIARETFPDMHDVGDALVHAGFAAPVMDMDRVTLTYGTFAALLGDLRAVGLRGAGGARRATLVGAGTREALAAAYDGMRVEGRLPATVEIVHGHAWWPEDGPARTQDGAHVVRIARRRG